ncbi:short transient receptor potential channel 4-associated protein-like isoform X1 [Biomphalaria glabrata]|uniref:Short transient receptor potential channel 4-associated protein-like isoform X1 n=1 Tax=Biomphalaria glabrata TaxID=6526 RepID=A0A9U8DUT9_BIOGL|nr:short transient receptor potential channel 4-associated protein-like isoform X1 [Biomphalaria glabrata]KAI8746483.1 short transient receptor potential channel 4-associated protein isoform X1 [Biomphalaria glabrata]
MCSRKRWRCATGQSAFRIQLDMQYTGKGPSRLTELPRHLLNNIPEGNEVVDIIFALDRLSVQNCTERNVNSDPNNDEAFIYLKKVLGLLISYEPRRPNNTEVQATDEGQDKFARSFANLGGIEIMIRFLMAGTVLPKLAFNRTEKKTPVCEHPRALRIKSLVLEILIKLNTGCVAEKALSKELFCDETMNYLFTLLATKKTFVNACQLIEDILQHRKDVLDLHRITNLRALVACLDDSQLANFCRILAVAISDLDIYENKSSLFAQNKQKRSKGFVNLRDINQELLLSIPDLLPRLVQIAISKEYTPRYRGMPSELDCWMEWIDNQMADEVYEPQVADDYDDFVGGVSEPTSEGQPMIAQQALTITEELVQRVEVVYVLGLFLLGKHRKKVQRKLAELKLASGLSDLFDQFIWKCQVGRSQTRHRLRGHNSSCECSPEVALKIQFLRLVHSFCDHSDYKHLLLSKSELNEVKKINVRAGGLTLQSLDAINKQLMCRGSKGLLTKIVEVMKKEPTTSTFRLWFWLARAVESYLRGDTSYCDQIFLMRRGLLAHVAGNIVESEIRHKEILQSSFDLLGELIKFNIEAFKAFDAILASEDKFDKFVTMVNKSLVDSNMFIRSLILSLENFRAEGSEKSLNFVTSLDGERGEKRESRLVSYIGDFSKQLEYLYKLINIISVQNLTQENVSCLNTTLVFLMFANKRNQLPKYLQALRDEQDDALENVNGTSSILQNFRDLLIFWQDHYLHKDKDCSALEKSSRISFAYWKTTVSMLVSEDKSLPTSVSYYINPLPSDRTN